MPDGDRKKQMKLFQRKKLGIGGMHMKKFETLIQKTCRILELVVAVLVMVGILLALISFFKDGLVFRELLKDIGTFQHYLDNIFMIVIGIEFLQMLFRPSADNVIEVIIFLVARHMIVVDTTPYEDLVSVISIAVLCLMRQYLHGLGEWKDTEKKS